MYYAAAKNNMGNEIQNTNRSKLLLHISTIDFAIIDLTEYLDTHPDDVNAVSYVKQYISIKKRLMKEYADRFGPLTLSCVIDNDCKEWIWAKMPLPWEGGCE